jgi:hypothetical protein
MKEPWIDLAWSYFNASNGPCKAVQYAVDLRVMTLLFYVTFLAGVFPSQLSGSLLYYIACLGATERILIDLAWSWFGASIGLCKRVRSTFMYNCHGRGVLFLIL